MMRRVLVLEHDDSLCLFILAKSGTAGTARLGQGFCPFLSRVSELRTPACSPHSSSSLQRNKTFFLSIKNCYLFLHRICWDQEEAKGTRSVEISNWGRWRSRGCRGIFHSVLKIMIMGIWFTYNTIKLCKFLFLSFKTVVPPKSRGDFPNLEILRFFWITLYAGVSNI